jgi:hypothetical protein
VVGYYDTSAYVAAAKSHLFTDEFRPAGYPALLHVLHALAPRVWVVLLFQHALGIATAGLLYLIVRDATGSRWLGLVPAAVVLLDALQIIVEHSVLSDATFVFLAAGALYAAQRAQRSPGFAWPAAAGALMTLAAVTRTVGLFLLPVVLIAVWWRSEGRRRARVLAVGACAASVAVLIGAYLGIGAAMTGHPVHLTKLHGWALYARVGQFADCRRFTPPPGTKRLCERRPSSARPSTDYYFWSSKSPARHLFGTPPAGDAALGAFARAAVLHQPLDYLSAVADDFGRYVMPHADERARAGQTQGEFISLSRDPTSEHKITGRLRRYYKGVGRPVQKFAGVTLAYAQLMRVEYVAMALLLLLAAAAPFAVRPRRRAIAATTAAAGFLLLIVPVATQVYDARYGVAALGPLSVAATLGAEAAVGRLRQVRPPRLLRARAAA